MKVRLTKDEAQEVMHKLGVLFDTPDLQEDYAITSEQAGALLDSVPRNGGDWEIPPWGLHAVRGEIADHCTVLRHISSDARSGGEVGQALRIAKQAKSLETKFVEGAQ